MRCLIGSQWSFMNNGVTCSLRFWRKTMRYAMPSRPQDLKCPFCCAALEDEMHALFYCKALDDLRINFIPSNYTKFPSFNTFAGFNLEPRPAPLARHFCEWTITSWACAPVDSPLSCCSAPAFLAFCLCYPKHKLLFNVFSLVVILATTTNEITIILWPCS